MVPIIEMTSDPRRIPEPLYLYEPADPKNAEIRRRKDWVIARVLKKSAHNSLSM